MKLAIALVLAVLAAIAWLATGPHPSETVEYAGHSLLLYGHLPSHLPPRGRAELRAIDRTTVEDVLTEVGLGGPVTADALLPRLEVSGSTGLALRLREPHVLRDLARGARPADGDPSARFLSALRRRLYVRLLAWLRIEHPCSNCLREAFSNAYPAPLPGSVIAPSVVARELLSTLFLIEDEEERRLFIDLNDPPELRLPPFDGDHDRWLSETVERLVDLGCDRSAR